MAVYIRFADSENVSPIIVGSAVDPSRMNWTGSGTNFADQTGNYTRGTNLLSWLNTNSATFNAFVNNTLRTNGTGTFTQDFLVYDSTVVKLSFKIVATAGKWEYKFSLIGNGISRIVNDRRFIYISASDANNIVDDELGNYGLFFICNPHVQQTPANLGIIWTWNPDWDTSYSPDARFRNNIFFPLYTFGDASRYQTYIRDLFYNSGQSIGPDSDEDGGWGDFNDSTDTITLPSVPGISALSAGFVNMYNPSPAQLQVLVNALWSNDISQVFWKMFTDPMESLVSLQIFPVAPEVTPASVNIVMGNVTLQDQSTTPITFALAPALTNQYKIIDCGSLQMNEYWGSALDYSPYTKAEIFLPYIGVKEIDINDVMAATLHLQYIVDFLTGTCTAQLECVKAQHIDFSAPLYHWQGNMAMAVPASASDMSQLITSIASTLVSAGLTVATGGSGAAIASGIAGGALNMANAHPRIEKGGTVAMTAGALDNQTPFIILTRPIQSKPAGFENYKGWPSNITAELGSLSGYTEVEYIHVEVAGATDEERNEIERLLKEGVII
jgi:F0F1-type ATP synthase membrane subunit c/vacuolar-type H+-ATPase subunit K